jgi:hypothetical protein
MSNSVVNFFRSLVHNTMSTREEKGILRPDMIQLLMEAKKETLRVDDDTTSNGKITKPSMYMEHNVIHYTTMQYIIH